ncbi:MAG: DUF368 domain-containing protein [Saprospiraceae bacterium]|nr:DUF368 domain-containing protein [Saprospiraceae bacterium]
MKEYIILFLKGLGMGAANVIPGVSGGTIALITGIFERLIDSIKSFNLTAVKLIFKGKFKEFAVHTDLFFLITVMLGAVVSVFSLAFVLKFLFKFYPIYIWSFFFGLIVASVYYVGRTIEKVNFGVVATFIIGTAIAVSISVLTPATENSGFIYLILCGVVAICSMILPGLSGSFVLILLGNYQLVMINAVSELNIGILIPVAIGAVFGLIAFSHLLSWVYKKYKDQTISLLTGFILGSLAILWPWKNSYDGMDNLIQTNKFGAFIENGNIIDKVKVFHYKQILPESFDSVVIIAIVLGIVGYLSIWLIEKFAKVKTEE